MWQVKLKVKPIFDIRSLRPAMLRGRIYRLLSPLFFRRVGRACQVFGPMRFAKWVQNIEVGDGAMLGHEVFWQVGGTLRIGDNFSLNRYSIMVANESVVIGNNVAVAEFVSIRDQEHNFSSATGVRGQGFKSGSIVIEDNCWVGRGVYIGPNSHIGAGSIVAANSVVRGKFPPRSLIAGAPAEVKRTLDLFQEDQP